ncbi:MAG TPA: MHYT domain-containing protein [Steroidobacteraceae bacterium]|nr:MHYT domain-containing protein [Steroidobacteraceae bacterium]
MYATYNYWLVALSIVVAIVVSYTALTLAGRVAQSERSGGRGWLVGGAAAMGIGIWSMHFIGMLAYSVPIPLRYDIRTTMASLAIAILTSGFALAIASRRNLGLKRLAASSVVMGLGICAMHYTGMAAIPIMPMINYSPPLVAASIAIAITASFAALWLAFRLRSGQSWYMILARAAAAIVMGCAISGMHYTAMAASMIEPGAYCSGGASLDNNWLAVTIALIALALLAIALITAIYDAHLESRMRRDSLRLEELNANLQHGKNLLTLATQAAGIACWQYEVATRATIWIENEIESLRAAGIDMRGRPDELMAMIHPDDACTALAAIRAAIAESRGVCALRVRIVVPTGETVHLQAHARLTCDPQGKLERVLGVCWDVTDEVRQEERRLELQMQLRDASHQAGKAEVATGVLHNVGNVLNSLGVSAALVLAGLRDSRVGNVDRVAKLLSAQGDRLRAFLENDPRGHEVPGYLAQLGEHLGAENRTLQADMQAVVTHVEHIGKIVAAQQSHARRGGISEEVDVGELADNALALNFSDCADITVKRDYRLAPRLTLDRHKLIQILGNLLSNARHALRNQTGGARLLTVRIREQAPGSLAIDIEDTGIGIETGALERLFEFGFTTKKDGHGFGLHASANLAKELGGDLSGHSEGPGRGACFTLRLPLSATHELSARKYA